nr:MAG TPA: hypothetical protein [Caudoviricetes sp.]
MYDDFIDFGQVSQAEIDTENKENNSAKVGSAPRAEDNEGSGAGVNEKGEGVEKNTDEGTAPNEGNGTVSPEDNTDDYIDVSYNNETRTLNRGEAATYALRGLELEGLHSKLFYLANAEGKSVDEYLENLLTIRENAYREELESRVTDQQALNDLMELYRSREKEKYEQTVLGRKKAEEEERQTRESEIADEFLKLQKEFPEIADFKSLPNEVKSAAAKGENLLSAYLLHRHREGQAVKKAEESAKAAAAASTGSMSSEHGNSEEAYAEFRKSLFEN